MLLLEPTEHVRICIDAEASNCTRPQRETRSDGRTYRTERTHYCWVRHGDPRDPLGVKTGQPLHVDKNGNTCAAGAGSILQKTWHGFLHNGYLVQC